MTLHYEAKGIQLWHGDCLDVLRELPGPDMGLLAFLDDDDEAAS